MKIQTIYKTMISYCFECRKNTDSINHEVVKTKDRRIMLFPKCSVCNSKNSKFLKEQLGR